MASLPAHLPSLPPSRSSPQLELAHEAAKGNLEATSALLKQLAPGMIRAVHALMGRLHFDVDDVVQQSLIALVQALPAFRAECSPAHYASRIVARMVVQVKHRARVRGERRDDAVEPDQVPDLQRSPPGEALSADRRREAVRQLLSEIPEEQAETFAMRIGLGFSLPEVAAATQVPLNTVRSRIRLAKQALKKRIDADPALLELLEVES